MPMPRAAQCRTTRATSSVDAGDTMTPAPRLSGAQPGSNPTISRPERSPAAPTIASRASMSWRANGAASRSGIRCSERARQAAGLFGEILREIVVRPLQVAQVTRPRCLRRYAAINLLCATSILDVDLVEQRLQVCEVALRLIRVDKLGRHAAAEHDVHLADAVWMQRQVPEIAWRQR